MLYNFLTKNYEIRETENFKNTILKTYRKLCIFEVHSTKAAIL